MNEIYFELINPKNTSKQCSVCGTINNQLELKDRKYFCLNENCTNKIDRDLNSCINIYLDFLTCKTAFRVVFNRGFDSSSKVILI